MRRRKFIKLLGGGAVAWPLAARAQQPTLPVIGFLSSRSPSESASEVAAFRQGLREAGFVERQNLAIEYRWAEGQYNRLPAMAADLIGRQVAVIVGAGGSAPAQAAKAATAKIPIVFISGSDNPVKDGLVASLNRPGGNVTGISVITSALGPKRFELLHELVPKASVVGILVNPNYGDADLQMRELQEAAGEIKLTIHGVSASTERDIDSAFASLIQQKIGALFVANDPFFTDRRLQIVALAARNALPVIYNNRLFVEAGGLISYGANFADGYRQAGNYVGRILKGDSPADLPVLRPTKFELVINLMTAKALGLTVPLIMQMTADEVIE
jgi:putative tryptophan/tyrosine transport system substrate-binding protein